MFYYDNDIGKKIPQQSCMVPMIKDEFKKQKKRQRLLTQSTVFWDSPVAEKRTKLTVLPCVRFQT